MAKTGFGDLIGSLFSRRSPKSALAGMELRASNGMIFRVTGQPPQGGMGVVYFCRMAGPGEEIKVALKTFPDQYFLNPVISASFAAEAQIWLRLDNIPFVMPLLGHFEIGQKPYLMMPLIEADASGCTTLADRIHKGSKGVPSGEGFFIALCIAYGLAKAGEREPGLVHGDLKPANVLMIGNAPMIADFGLAQLRHHAQTSRGLMGTPHYRAPECWKEGAPLTIASDVYAFGCLVFEMLHGRPVFDGSNDELEAAHRSADPPFAKPRNDEPMAEIMLKAVVMACLSKEPSRRPDGFQMVYQFIRRAAEEAGQKKLLAAFEDLVGGSVLGGDELTRILSHRLSSMMEVGDYDGARRLLAETPPEKIRGETLITAGTAASLGGDDVSALKYFQRYKLENPDPDPVARARCANEQGLSLRRLKRYAEASAVFTEAIERAPPDMGVQLKSNYAGVLLETGDAEDAVRLLQTLVRRDPSIHTIWGLLCQAAIACVDGEMARLAATKAIGLAPRDGSYRVLLASVLMDIFGDFEGALAALDASYGLGYTNLEWVHRTFVCNMLTGKQAEAAGLLKSFGESIPEDQSADLIKSLMSDLKKYFEGAPPFISRVQKVEADPTHPPPTEQRPDVMTNIKAGHPHVQMKFSAVDGSLALDVYFDTSRQDYAEAAARSVRRARDRHRDSVFMSEQFVPRSREFGFHACQGCSFVVLSNRDEGEAIRCQICEHRGQVHKSNDPALKSLAGAINATLAEPIKGNPTALSAVGIWPSSEEELRAIEPVMREFGLVREASPMFGALITSTLAQRGIMRRQGPAVWTCPAAEDPNETPPTFAEALRKLKRAGRTITSTSITITPDMAQVMRAGIAGALASMQAEFDSNPHDPAVVRRLVQTLCTLERVADARSTLVRALATVPDAEDPDILAAGSWVDLAEGNVVEARKKIERAVSARPGDQLLRLDLIKILKQAGDEEALREAYQNYVAGGDVLSQIYPRTR